MSGQIPGIFERPSDDLSDYGLVLNQITVESLFAKYRELGLLYPEKLRRLAPYFSNVEQNWSMMMAAGECLFRVYTSSNKNNWSSIGGWRTSLGAWTNQHHVSTGEPVNTGKCLL